MSENNAITIEERRLKVCVSVDVILVYHLKNFCLILGNGV